MDTYAADEPNMDRYAVDGVTVYGVGVYMRLDAKNMLRSRFLYLYIII